MHQSRVFRQLLSVALALAFLAFAGVALATHPRPGGGTPYRVPLVPTFQQCTSPNSEHAEPVLRDPRTVPPINPEEPDQSCAPPVLESALLRMGTAGAGSGSVRADVFCDPAAGAASGETPPCLTTPGDQVDIKFVVSASDVRCAVGPVTGCSASAADYTGSLQVRVRFRLTDHANGNPATICGNGTGTGCGIATMTDGTVFPGELPFIAELPCADNGGPNGASCLLATTVDALYPNTEKEFQRMVIATQSVTVNDPGLDGSFGTGDDAQFLEQGIFLP